MTEKLDILTLQQNVELCYAYSRDNQKFNEEQRQQLLIQSEKCRQRFAELVAAEFPPKLSPNVQQANDKLKSINKQLQDTINLLAHFNQIITELQALVGILNGLIKLVTPTVGALPGSTLNMSTSQAKAAPQLGLLTTDNSPPQPGLLTTDNSKSIVASKTFWGIILTAAVAIVPTITSNLKISTHCIPPTSANPGALTCEEQRWNQEVDASSKIILAILGASLAIYGRAKAYQTIKG